MEFERVTPLEALVPAVDVFNGGFNTAGFNIANYEKLVFVFNYTKTGTVGSGKLLVKAADNVAKDNPVNIKFHYFTKLAEVESAIAEAVAANGVTTAPNTTGLVIIEVRQRQCPDDKPFVFVNGTEVADEPIKGSMIVLGFNPQVSDKPSLLA